MTLQQGEAPAPDAPPPSARTLFLRVFPNLMLPMFLAVIDQTIVAAALPAIAADLGDVERVSWVVVAYLVATTIAAPVYGRLGDVFGRRRMMLVALAVFATACVLCSLATSVAALAAFRVLQGLGGGGLMTTAQALIGETVPPRERGRYQGYLATVVVTASMFGPVAGGLLSGTFGWRSIFVVNLPLALIAAVLALRLPARRAAPDAAFRFDVIGLALLTTFVVVTLGGLAQLTRPGQVGLWGVLGGVVLVLASVVLLVRHEKRTPSPLLPMGLLGRPAIWRADALAACHGAALVSLISYLPLYLTTVRGTTAAQTGLLLLPALAALSPSPVLWSTDLLPPDFDCGGRGGGQRAAASRWPCAGGAAAPPPPSPAHPEHGCGPGRARPSAGIEGPRRRVETRRRSTGDSHRNASTAAAHVLHKLAPSAGLAAAGDTDCHRSCCRRGFLPPLPLPVCRRSAYRAQGRA